MRKVFLVTEGEGEWAGASGIGFCQLRTYFDIPAGVTEVAVVLSDKKHPEAYKLRLDADDDDEVGAVLYAEASDGDDIYILNQTRRVWTPFITKGMVYLTLEC